MAQEAVQEGEQASTSVMPHPPGAENEPDDRAQYVQDPTYVEDADGNQVPTGGAGEDGTAPEMWPTHAADAIQVCVACFGCHCLHEVQACSFPRGCPFRALY